MSVEIRPDVLETIRNCRTVVQGEAGHLMVMGSNPPGRAEAEAALKCLVQNMDDTLAELERLSQV